MASNTGMTIAIIGCGNIGTAIAAAILRAPSDPRISIGKVIATVASEQSQQRVISEISQYSGRLDVRLKARTLETLQEADVVFLSIKSAKRDDIFGLEGFRQAVRGKLIISLMSGLNTEYLNRMINGEGPSSSADCEIIRAQPNMAVKISQSMTLATFIPGKLSPAHVGITEWLFGQVGEFGFFPESHFDIAGVLVGCSGSLLMLAVDGLLDAAVAEGVKRSDAQPLVINSAIGLLSLLTKENGGHPSIMREKIASPGGNSIRGLLDLESRGVRSAFTSAIMKAAERSKSMSKL